MKHVMLDIETMGTGINACVVAIGAFKFDKDTDFAELGKAAPNKNLSENVDICFYEVPEWDGDMTYATVQWWLSQSAEARDAILAGPKIPLSVALEDLVKFIGNCEVWGNGSDFDNAIIQSHLKRLNLKGWSYRNNRCFRTVKNLYDSKAYTKPIVPHHALYDAVAQAQTLVALSKFYGIPL